MAKSGNTVRRHRAGGRLAWAMAAAALVSMACAVVFLGVLHTEAGEAAERPDAKHAKSTDWLEDLNGYGDMGEAEGYGWMHAADEGGDDWVLNWGHDYDPAIHPTAGTGAAFPRLNQKGKVKMTRKMINPVIMYFLSLIRTVLRLAFGAWQIFTAQVGCTFVLSRQVQSIGD